MSRTAILTAFSAALLLAGCSYSSESNFLGYHSSTSFSTPGAAPPPAYNTPPASYPPSTGFTEAPPYPPAYAPLPGYYAPPAYYGPSVGISFGRWWGRGRYRR